MGNILMTGAGGGGAGSDDCTATAAELLKGYTGILKGSDDEPVQGTLELTGNAQAAHVLNGETFYSNDAKTKHTGNMTVNSLLSFSVAAYSGRRVLAKWQNPRAASGRPYSGIYIRYSTDGYPGAGGGVQIYKGAGNNTMSEGWSQVFLDLPNVGTTYYFSAIPYVTCSVGELLGAPVNAVVTTGGQQVVTVTGTQNYIIPEGYPLADIFCVGGGGGGGRSSGSTSNMYAEGGKGGGGGYTNTAFNVLVNPGEILNCIIGAGGAGATYDNSRAGTGGVTSVSKNGAVLCTADGGYGGNNSRYPGTGGSNGGKGAYNDYDGYKRPGETGASDGNPGQGRTTRAFGESWNTLYGGGGGGGDCDSGLQGAGGAGGGGAGGNGRNRGNDGAANTGGGGGGGAGTSGVYGDGGNGASGIILIRLK